MDNSFFGLISGKPIMLAGIAFVGIAIVQQWWRYNRAKDAAASWLRRHHYRVQSLSSPPKSNACWKIRLRIDDPAPSRRVLTIDLRGGAGPSGKGEALERVQTVSIGIRNERGNDNEMKPVALQGGQ